MSMMKKQDVRNAAKNSKELREIVDSLHNKVTSELVTYKELRIIKFFVAVIIGLLIIFEIISISLILSQK
jgi:hypothetical protein